VGGVATSSVACSKLKNNSLRVVRESSSASCQVVEVAVGSQTALASVRTRFEDRRRAGSLRGTVGRPYQRRRPRGEWGITDLARLASGASCSRTKRSASAWRNRARHPRTLCRSPRRPLRRRTTRTNATTRTRTTRRRGTPRVARQVRVVSIVPWIDRIRFLDSMTRSRAARRAVARGPRRGTKANLTTCQPRVHTFFSRRSPRARPSLTDALPPSPLAFDRV
jgi:hypothetical protein